MKSFKEQADDLMEILKIDKNNYDNNIKARTLIEAGEYFIKIQEETEDYFKYLRGKIGYLAISRGIELKEWNITTETKEEIQESITKLKEIIK